MTSSNFALIGAGGYIAPRHLKAIRDTGNKLVAAADTKDSVGVLDSFGFDVRFFTETERLDRHLEKLKRGPAESRVNWFSVCTPNYLHDAHCRLGMRIGADVICEKPLVINPWNLDALAAFEQETGRRVFSVLQLRVHAALVAVREKLLAQGARMHDVDLTYVTSRGPWYDVSWKGQLEKSGGVLTNIGIHLFDLLTWLFGSVTSAQVHLQQGRRAGGTLQLERARVRWFISIESSDLPFAAEPGKKTTFRSITVDGAEVEFSEGFGDLHTQVYAQTLAGRGFGISEARGAIELVHDLREKGTSAATGDVHPKVFELLKKG